MSEGVVSKDFLAYLELNMSDKEAIRYIRALSNFYAQHRDEEGFYKSENFIPENIIALYLNFVLKRDYSAIVEDYKNKFVVGEANVEPGVLPEEQIGLGRIYDYISTFDYENKNVDIFVEGLRLHGILYSAVPHPEFGGQLRQEGAILHDTCIDVPTAQEARQFFQSFVCKKIDVKDDDVFAYIDECIRIAVDLIKYQPFPDGNKRVFRALLNMLLAKIKIPPIFIRLEEREVYKAELLTAMDKGDYTGITRFYYHKICDAIIDYGIEDFKKEDKPKKFSLQPIEQKNQ